MTNGAATVSSSDERTTSRVRMQRSALPALFVASGLALAYAGALAAFLLGARSLTKRASLGRALRARRTGLVGARRLRVDRRPA